MEYDLTDLRVIKSVLSRHGFAFAKRLGQNFLVNPSVCPRMAELAEIDGADVLEIGPGVGVLTVQLARRASRVLAVELDAKLLPVLEETLAPYNNIKVIHGDILKLDLQRLICEQLGGESKRLCVCANLPYYITSPILMGLLESRLPFESITVLVQKEAAQRICAPMGSRECGAITAAVRYYARPRLMFTVSPGSFYPPPKVESAVLRLELLKEPPVAISSEKAFFAVVKAAFAQRRKTLPNALSSGLGITKERAAAALGQAQVPLNARAEQLLLQDFAAISAALG
ncbi:MAG: 16S rRNA (adenine(1518)-N(6)/adenine(1519)-N(6))-dimethyltransferase RsmA [Clostridium sp.]|jgi:16S rRNA (adenine1518-N6/adenine1519-N6)-dimethyltransferase|nr:16S rRNA (adenine(1518)-N(6)/adenine(1519)-N(6))-dimethyltransferase RsmA [Clostridium sp.]